MESEGDHQSVPASSLLLSQERLIRKAAGLSHFLINEVAVAPVSPLFYTQKNYLLASYATFCPVLSNLFYFLKCEKNWTINQHLYKNMCKLLFYQVDTFLRLNNIIKFTLLGAL